jgi:hypothetical protein
MDDAPLYTCRIQKNRGVREEFDEFRTIGCEVFVELQGGVGTLTRSERKKGGSDAVGDSGLE